MRFDFREPMAGRDPSPRRPRKERALNAAAFLVFAVLVLAGEVVFALPSAVFIPLLIVVFVLAVAAVLGFIDALIPDRR